MCVILFGGTLEDFSKGVANALHMLSQCFKAFAAAQIIGIDNATGVNDVIRRIQYTSLMQCKPVFGLRQLVIGGTGDYFSFQLVDGLVVVSAG